MYSILKLVSIEVTRVKIQTSSVVDYRLVRGALAAVEPTPATGGSHESARTQGRSQAWKMGRVVLQRASGVKLAPQSTCGRVICCGDPEMGAAERVEKRGTFMISHLS